MLDASKPVKDSPWNTGSRKKPFGRGVNLQIMVKDARKTQAALSKAGCKIRMTLTDNWYRAGKAFAVTSKQFAGYYRDFFNDSWKNL